VHSERHPRVARGGIGWYQASILEVVHAPSKGLVVTEKIEWSGPGMIRNRDKKIPNDVEDVVVDGFECSEGGEPGVLGDSRLSSSSKLKKAAQQSDGVKNKILVLLLVLVFGFLVVLKWNQMQKTMEGGVAGRHIGQLAKKGKIIEKYKQRLRARKQLEAQQNQDSGINDENAKRLKAVQSGFVHAWKGYKKFAWGKDSLHPVSKTGSDDFLGMAISIVDSMDTALIMGLDEIFEEQYKWVVANMAFGTQENINVFETTIRVLGGLLGAYGLSNRQPLLDFAEDLAKRLLPAFETRTGIPYGTIGLRTGRVFNPGWVSGQSSVAEAGTLQLEFRYLSFLTGKYAF